MVRTTKNCTEVTIPSFLTRSHIKPREARRARAQNKSAATAPAKKEQKSTKSINKEELAKQKKESAKINRILKSGSRTAQESLKLGKFLAEKSNDEEFGNDQRNIKVKWTPSSSQNQKVAKQQKERKCMKEMEIRKKMFQLKNNMAGARRIYKCKAQDVLFEDEQNFILAEKRFRKKISEDPCLSGMQRLFQTVWRSAHLDYVARGIQVNMSSKKTILGKNAGKGKIVAREHIPYALNARYTPPQERVLVIENLTGNPDDVIPVYSDLPGENKRNVEIVETLYYTYGDRNLISPGVAAKFAKFEKSTDVIKCKCCSKKPLVPCWANPDCECSKVARALRKGDNKWISPVGTTEPEKLNHWTSIDFSCSELCACKGNCSNNSLLTVGKSLFELEVYRRDRRIGNSIRTMNAIPAGSVVTEFVGDLVPESQFNEKDNDFSYTVLHGSEGLTNTLDRALRSCPAAKWNEKTKKEHEALMTENWILNPKWYGNVSRTFGHSCAHNLMAIRVFQKGFSPANLRMVLVAMFDIFPGTELSIDYGNLYMQGALEEKCLCGTLPCPSNPTGWIFSKEQIKSWLMVRHENSLTQFRENISSQVDEKSK